MRPLIISIVIHILVLNFIWVGFSVSIVRKNSIFVYLGEAIAPAQGMKTTASLADQNIDTKAYVGNEETSSWIEMRQVNKPH